MKHSENFLKLVEDAKTRVKEVSVPELLVLLDEQAELLIIDVREYEEWELGTIPTAIHISRGTLERDVEDIIHDKDILLVLFCSGGYRSVLACDTLLKMGYKKLVSLKGGYKAWLAQGLPVDLH